MCARGETPVRRTGSSRSPQIRNIFGRSGKSDGEGAVLVVKGARRALPPPWLRSNSIAVSVWGIRALAAPHQNLQIQSSSLISIGEDELRRRFLLSGGVAVTWWVRIRRRQLTTIARSDPPPWSAPPRAVLGEEVPRGAGRHECLWPCRHRRDTETWV